MSKITDINQHQNRQHLMELSQQLNEAIKLTPATTPYKSINIPNFIPPLSEWFLGRLDAEVTNNKDFLIITDSHFSHGSRYVDYQSKNAIDYDELIEKLLEQSGGRPL